MKLISILAAGALAAASSNPARATTLLDLVDPTPGSSGSYALTFTSTSTLMTLSVAGYQVSGFTKVTDNHVMDSTGGNDLLPWEWSFKPAAAGSDAMQYNDYISFVNGLCFGGVSVGNYDIFSQTLVTKVGDTYTYSFDVAHFDGNPDALRVTVNAIPEPAPWSLALAGACVVGYARRRRGPRAGSLQPSTPIQEAL